MASHCVLSTVSMKFLPDTKPESVMQFIWGIKPQQAMLAFWPLQKRWAALVILMC